MATDYTVYHLTHYTPGYLTASNEGRNYSASLTTLENGMAFVLGRIDGKANTAPKSKSDLDTTMNAKIDASASAYAAYYISYVIGFVAGILSASPNISGTSGADATVVSMAYDLGKKDALTSTPRTRSAMATELARIFA